jgi:Domain of unknown function (DUF4331)
MKRIVLGSITALTVIAAVALTGHTGYASDHDDGETDLKARALNLTDHFAFKSPGDPSKLSLIMYFNPRSLPGKQYFLSTKARYELHVTKVATRTTAPTGKDDFVFRFEAAAPDATGAQAITLTVFKDGQSIGTSTGMTTTIGASKAGSIVTNNGSVGGMDVKYFVGPRADSFHFDVVRFFQVRAFLAQRFFGGPGGIGDATAEMPNNCRGDKFLALGAEANPDADTVNLFNPPSCAPDFTKNLNVTAIVLNVPIAQLGGGAIFDTWSTISVTE